ncbi:glycosyltransferase family 4 protein [Jatrophihabitans sp. YIM 134969]
MNACTPDRPLRVVVVGNAPAGPDSRGGMASVVRLMALEAAADPSVALTVVPTYRDVGALGRLVTWVTGVARVGLLLRRREVDVLHVHLSHGGSVARKAIPMALARRRGVPVVLHAHSFNFATWYDGLSATARRLTRRTLQADAVVVLSPSQREVYRHRLDVAPEHVEEVANPASLPDDTRAWPDSDADAPMGVVFLGRYGERKGVGDLVAAVARLTPDERARLHVVTAGDGEIEQVRADVEALGLTGTVEVHGWLEPAARDDLLARSQVFVLPSYDEALPMALIEAMAFGLVPIVTPVGGLPDLVHDGDNGVLVDVGDPEAIARALRAMLDDPERRRAIADRARASVETLDAAGWWERLTGIWAGLTPPRG